MTTGPRQFLPGTANTDTSTSNINPRNSAFKMGNGPIAGYTVNYGMNLINFDWVTWHDYEWDNWVQVDALLYAAIGFLNLRGVWRPNTEYLGGQSVFDPADTTKIYLCMTPHTSSTNFENDKPLYWELRDEVTTPVQSVFGRIGEVAAHPDDYAQYNLRLDGSNVMTGPLLLNRDNWDIIRFTASNNSNPFETRIRLLSGGNVALVHGVDDANAAVFAPQGPDLSSNATVVTREKGDARYLQQSGGLLTGGVTIDSAFNPSNANGKGIQLNSATQSGAFEIQAISTASGGTPMIRAYAGTEQVFRMQANGQLRFGNTTTYSNAINEYTGDLRYLRLDGGTITGGITFAQGINVIGGMTVDGNSVFGDLLTVSADNGGFTLGHGGSNAYLDNTGGGNIEFRFDNSRNNYIEPAGNLVMAGKGVFGDSGSFVGGVTIEAGAPSMFLKDTTAGDNVRVYADGGQLRIAAVDDDLNFLELIARIDRDGGLSQGNSIVTRASGDARYKRTFDRAWLNATGSRNAGTTYTNTTDAEMVVSINMTSSNTGGGTLLYAARILVDDVVVVEQTGIDRNSGSQQGNLSTVIPPGSTYKLTITHGTILSWHELRE